MTFAEAVSICRRNHLLENRVLTVEASERARWGGKLVAIPESQARAVASL